jgi:immune inhibitor A
MGKNQCGLATVSFFIILISLSFLFSMPPNPYLPKDRPVYQIVFPAKVEKPEPIKAPVLGTQKALVLLVDFSDKTSIYTKDQIQTLLFASTSNSLTGYYQEVSYGQFTLTGEVNLWVRAPQPYSYYVGDSFGIYKPYPNNSQKLVEDVVALADAQIDFSEFDENGDGLVENLFIVHAGPGAEETQRRTDMWSHKWQLSDGRSAYQTNDGVKVDVFTIQPERFDNGTMITIGVFAHEFGHTLGLPDLYDTDYSSSGLGWFCLMAAGSWASSNKDGQPGSSPVHPCAWSKYALGWLNPDALERGGLDSIESALLPTTARTAKAYRFLANPNGMDWTEQDTGIGEYFLVENRYQTGFDQGLPGSGLLILHIDESQPGNSDERNPLVGIIQANRLGYALPIDDRGSAATLWKDDSVGFQAYPNPYSEKPYSKFYNGSLSGINITNISISDSIMNATLEISPLFLGNVYSYPNPVVVQNNNERLTIIYIPTDTAKFKEDFPDFAVKIFNLAGEYITTLIPDSQQRRQRLVVWDLKNEKDYDIASGLYFYLFELKNDEGVTERSKGKFTIIR